MKGVIALGQSRHKKRSVEMARLINQHAPKLGRNPDKVVTITRALHVLRKGHVNLKTVLNPDALDALVAFGLLNATA